MSEKKEYQNESAGKTKKAVHTQARRAAAVLAFTAATGSAILTKSPENYTNDALTSGGPGISKRFWEENQENTLIYDVPSPEDTSHLQNVMPPSELELPPNDSLYKNRQTVIFEAVNPPGTLPPREVHSEDMPPSPTPTPSPQVTPSPVSNKPTSTPMPTPVDSSESQTVYQQVENATIQAFGADDWPAMEQIIRHESGFNPYATNSVSGACGLFQFFPCPGNLSVRDQIARGISYIRTRYGDPDNAWAFWRSHGWY